MNEIDQLCAWAAVVSGTIFATTFLAIILDRTLDQRRRRAVQKLTDTLVRPRRQQLDPRTQQAWSNSYLSSLGLRQVRRIATETALPPIVESVVCAYLLATLGLTRVHRDATAHRNEASRWNRIAALRVLAFGAPDEAWPALERALIDRDKELVGVVVTILGGMTDPRAEDLLVKALRAGWYSRSRIATFLDRCERDVSASIEPLLRHPAPMVRYWGALLISRYPSLDGAAAALAGLTRDEAPMVRRAALESLAAIGGQEASACARERLDDEEWVVRVHAARALGVLKDVGAAPLVARLLADREWWVRYAAKTGLEAMGAGVERHLLPLLTHADAFARNGAAEVLQNLGVFERLLTETVDGHAVRGYRASLAALAEAGGEQMREAVLDRLAPEVREHVASLLATLRVEPGGAIGA